MTPPSGGEHRGESRRRLLTTATAGAGALLLSGCGKRNPLHTRIRQAGPVPLADVALLNGLLDLEHYAIAAYGAGIPLMTKGSAVAAQQFLAQEISHAGELSGLVREAGAKPNDPLPAYDLGHPRTNDEVLALLHRIETSQLAAYVRAIPRLQPGKVRAAAMAVLANDAQHVTILRLQLGLDPVPAAFVTGSE